MSSAENPWPDVLSLLAEIEQDQNTPPSDAAASAVDLLPTAIGRFLRDNPTVGELRRMRGELAAVAARLENTNPMLATDSETLEKAKAAGVLTALERLLGD